MNWLHLGVSKVPSRGVLICVCQFPFRRKENCNSLVLKHGVVFQQVEKELLDVTYIYPPRVCMKMCPPLLSSEKPETPELGVPRGGVSATTGFGCTSEDAASQTFVLGQGHSWLLASYPKLTM